MNIRPQNNQNNDSDNDDGQDGDTGESQNINSNPDSWNVPDAAIDKIPNEWGESKPNKKKEGFRWTDPENKGNGIRIDKGDPNHRFTNQQVDHVVINYNGKVIGRDGEPIKGSIRNDADNAHISLSEWQNWQNWNSP
jgi:filamentous hemagglutinin